MAKRKSGRRGARSTAIEMPQSKRRSSVPVSSMLIPSPSYLPQLSLPGLEAEDRRLFYPDDLYSPARTRSGSQSYRLVAGTSPARKKNVSRYSGFDRPSSVPWRVGFASPSRVMVCIRRKIRRGVMHALGYAGKTGFRRSHRNYYSSVRC